MPLFTQETNYQCSYAALRTALPTWDAVLMAPAEQGEAAKTLRVSFANAGDSTALCYTRREHSLCEEPMPRVYIAALDGCDLCVALLTGPDQDSGTSAELGYMFAQGKTCFGVTDDFRYLNNMLWDICGEGRRIARDIDGLMALLAAWRTAGEPAGATSRGPAPVERGLLAEAEAIIRRRSEEFVAQGGPSPPTLETVGWTLDELLEEAEDADYATRDNRRVRDLSIARDLLALLGSALEPGDGRRA